MAIKGLGRGLDALFAENENEQVNETQLKISDISPDRGQPRSDFDEDALNELADSIAEHGVLQPILVRPTPDGGYMIVAGERRWRAARIAGFTEIPAIVKTLTDEQAMTIALVENLQREDLNPVEEAQGYKKLMETLGITQEEAAKRVGRSRPAVANALRLLALPAGVLELLRKGELSTGHAKAILSAPEELREDLARRAVKERMSVRETEKLAAKKPAEERAEERAAAFKDPIAGEVELALKEALGVEVSVNYRDGRGSLTVGFYSKEQLMEIANKLGK